ncbi:InlB B-repeat-containing protein [Erysipelothrix aquatica]|uniref:InlB B-repeat-containing protein n=1 Tax=Erysipelothrix aquatica TaxID=2683714 RepID=UPI001356EB49|nr:InlB B-repeat-containing protein [Erysipelothrix aquatica]
MKKFISLCMVILMAFVTVPITAESEKLDSMFSDNLQDYVRTHAYSHADKLLTTDEEFIEYVKTIESVGFVRGDNVEFNHITVFDFKGIEYFESLNDLTVTISLPMYADPGRKLKEVKNFTKLPQNFIDSGNTVKVQPGIFLSSRTIYVAPHYLYTKGQGTGNTRPDRFDNIKKEFSKQMTNFLTQYQGERIVAEIEDYDVVVDDFNWLNQVNRNIDLSMSLETQDRIQIGTVHNVPVNDKEYYEFDIDSSQIPDVIVADGNKYRAAGANEKTIGIDYEATKAYVQNYLTPSGSPLTNFEIVATLTDGRTFTADQDFTLAGDGSDTDKFFSKGTSSDGIRGAIDVVKLRFEKSDAVKALVMNHAEQYEIFRSETFPEVTTDYSKDMALNPDVAINHRFFADKSGLTIQSYFVNDDNTLRTNPFGIKPIFVGFFGEPYTVTYNYDNGADPLVLTEQYEGTHLAKPQNPIKDGFKFDGWYTSEDFATAWNFDTMQVTDDLDLYAKWSTSDVTVTFVDGGVSTPVSTKFDQPLDTSKIPSTIKEGYTFKEWNTQADGKGTAFDTTAVVKADQTVYAIYEANNVTVTFVDGTTSTPVVTKYNQALDASKIPATVKEGYTFKEWNTQADGKGTAFDTTAVVKADQTVYAIYEKNIVPIQKVTVKFVVGTLTSAVTVDINTVISADRIPSTIKTGYTFKGWNTKIDGLGAKIDFTKAITEDQTVYAIYDKDIEPVQKVTITFVDGETTTPVVIDVNTVVSANQIPTTAKAGYTFKGWNTQADGKGLMIDLTQPITTDQTVYAIYEKNIVPVETVTVTFVDGSIKTPVVVAINTVIPGAKIPATIKDGYTFKGWNTQADDKGQYFDTSIAIAEDITLYAIYEKNETKPVLPATGVASNSYILVGGAVLIVSGLYLSLKGKKQENN